MSTEWFYAKGRIIDETGSPLVFPDAHPDSGDYILFMNPSQSTAEIELTFYFEDRPPVVDHTCLGAERVAQHPLHVKSKDVLPWNTNYGVRVRSSIPIICQRTHGQWLPGDPVTENMASFILYPGPLGDKEKNWCYADGIRCWREDHLLEESEWVSILNPNPDPAELVITAYHAGDREPTRWKETVPGERIKVIKLDDQEWVIPYELYGIMVDSSLPVVVEELRHAYERGKYQCPRSIFSIIAYPGFKQG